MLDVSIDAEIAFALVALVGLVVLCSQLCILASVAPVEVPITASPSVVCPVGGVLVAAVVVGFVLVAARALIIEVSVGVRVVGIVESSPFIRLVGRVFVAPVEVSNVVVEVVIVVCVAVNLLW